MIKINKFIKKIPIKFILLGIFISIIYWFIEVFIHILYYNVSFVNGFLPGDLHELWMRSIAVIILLLSSIIIQILMNARQKIFDELLITNNNFNSLVENSPFGFIVHIDGKFVYVNKRALQIFGVFKEEELLGENLMDFVHPDFHKDAYSNIYKVYNLKTAVNLQEQKIIQKNGNIIDVNVTSVPVIHENQPASLTLLINISRQNLVKRQLIDNERKFRLLFNRSFDILIIVDKSGTIEDVNLTACRLLKYTKEELLNIKLNKIIQTKDIKRIKTVANRIVDVRVEYIGDMKLLRSDDVELDVETGAVSFRFNDDDYIIYSFRDVTERLRTEKLVREKEDRFRAMVENTADLIWETDDDACLTYVSPNVKDLLGYETDEIVGKKIYKLYPIFNSKSLLEIFRLFVKHREPINNYENIMVNKNGKMIVFETNGVPYYDNDNNYKGYRGINRNISDRKHYEEQLVLSENVFVNSIEGIVITDADAYILKVNPAFTDITGYSSKEAIGKKPGILKSNRHSKEFYKEMWDSLIKNGQWNGEIWNRKKTGEAYPEWLSITAIKDLTGRITHYVSIFHDISEKKISEEKIKHLSSHDALTGLPNRDNFYNRLNLIIQKARKNKNKIALLFLDVDNFKNINDSFGHPVGDSLLIEIKTKILTVCEEKDILARYGGDEFVIIFTNVANEELVIYKAKQIIDLFAVPIHTANREIYATISIGITLFPDDGGDIVTLEKNADMALHNAKKLGKNTYSLFTDSLNYEISKKIDIEYDMRKAIINNDFLVYYQPKFNIFNNQIVGTEALIRWRNNEKWVSPVDFIPIAEETGLILDIGKWVLFTACNETKMLHDKGFNDLKISINLSARQLQDNSFFTTVKQILQETNINPELVFLEITENIAMIDVENTLETMNSLSELGLRFSLDDFGTGYSSLAYLKKFPISELKIDRTFIKDIPKDLNDAAIAKTIISMAKTLNFEITAEGVETKEQIDFLIENQCEIVQGYYFSKPLTYNELFKLLQKN